MLSSLAVLHDPEMACDPDGPLATRVSSPLPVTGLALVKLLAEFEPPGISVGRDRRLRCSHHFARFLCGLLNGVIVDDFDGHTVEVGISRDPVVLPIGLHRNRRRTRLALVGTILQQVNIRLLRKLRIVQPELPRTAEGTLRHSYNGKHE